MANSKVCAACDFRTLVIEAENCARCGEKFVAKAEAEEPPVAKAAGKAKAARAKKGE